MKSGHPTHLAEAFRAAVENHDFTHAEQALRDYIAWFKSASRNRREVEDAMNLFTWGIQVTCAGRRQMAEELMRLRSLVDAYLPRRRSETWRVVG